MGQILVLKNADFSNSAVSLDNVYDTVKETDGPALNRPMSYSSYYNTKPFEKDVKIYAVGITLPSSVSYFQFTYENQQQVEVTKWADYAKLRIGACDPSDGTGIRPYIVTDVSYLIDKVKEDSSILGTNVIVRLSEPVVIEAGNCVFLTDINDGNPEGTPDWEKVIPARFFVYSHEVTYTNPRGIMIPITSSGGSPSTYESHANDSVFYNLAVTFYGVELSSD